MSVRALVVAPQPFFTPRGTPFSVYYRTLILAEQGVEVDLLTYGAGQDVEIDGVRLVRVPRLGFLGDVPVGPSLVKPFHDALLLLWMLGLLLRNRYDFVHAHEEAVFWSRFLAPVFRTKLVYDMHSSLPQQLVNFRFTRSRFWIGLFERLENSALRAADAVITICPDLAHYALGIVDDPDKHFLIENSIFDPVRLAPREAARVEAASDPRAPLPAPEGRPLVVYAGTLEAYQGIDLLLRAFQSAQRRVADAFLLVVGGTPAQVAEYRALAHELGLDAHCAFTGRVPQAVARRACEAAAAQVSPRIHGTNTPLKVYEQLASGVPLVATKIHSHTQVLDDAVAFLVDPEPEQLADGVVAALTDAAARRERSEAARRLYDAKYARAAYVQKMQRLLARLA